MRQLLLGILLLISTTFSYGQGATIFASSTDCNTWDCNPCDGTVTVWLEGATLPATYSFVLTGTQGFIDTIEVVNDTIVTFTGLCEDLYTADSFWPASGNPGAPANPLPCNNCSPSGGGGGNGGGGSGASAAVGAPDPNLTAYLSGDVTECMCWPGGFNDNVQLDITGQAPPFQASFDGTSFFPVGSSYSFYLDCMFGWNWNGMWVMDATGQIVQVVELVTGGCVGCVYAEVPNDFSVCSGELVPETVFTMGDGWVSGVSPSSDPWNEQFYYWFNSDPSIGLPSSGTGSLPSFTAANVTVPTTAVFEVWYGDQMGGCSQSQATILEITILPLDQIDAGPDTGVCLGTTATLTASSNVPFTWDNGVQDGIPFAPTFTDIYTVTTSGSCPNSDQVIVNVGTWETVDAGPDQAVCQGESVTLNATSSVGFDWWNGIQDGISFVPTQTTTYTVSTLGDCPGTDFVTVTVNPLPNVNAGIDLQLCDGQQATLSGSGAQSYTWDNGITDGQSFVQGIGSVIYTVTGTDAYGCVVTDDVQITVDPNISVDAGLDQSVCSGQSVTLSASGGMNYAWDNGVVDGMSFTPGVGTITYAVYDQSTCSDTDYVDVTVYDLPVVDAGLDQDLCDDGSQITLSGSGAQSYSWDNGVIDGQAFSQTVGTTTYTVTGTDANGCINTDQVDVTINALPSVNAGPDQILCDDGTQVVLAGSGAQSYSWNNGVIDNTAFIQSPGTTAYIVIGTDNNGCTNSDTVDVTVNALPVVVAGPDVEVCEGIQVTLSASGASSYVWDNGVTDGVAFLPPVGLTTYSVIGTDANGCKNTDQLDVLVHPTPSIDAGADQILCDNIPITLTAVGTGFYSWNNGIQDGVPFEQDVGIVTYTVSTIDAFGCTNEDSVVVEVEDSPDVDFTASDTTGCIPLTVLLNNTSTSTSAITDCIWNINGELIEDCGPVWYTFDQSGNYDVGLSVTSATGCTSGITSIGYISIEDDPIAAFTSSESELLLWDTEVHFTNNSIGAVDYFWDFGDLSSSSEVHPSHVYDEEHAHSYVVELIAYTEYGCSDTAYTIIQIREDLIYYVPNTFTPDGDQVNQTFKPIFYSGFDPYDYQLLIFNRWGELIFESKDPEIGWDGTYGSGAATKHCQDGTYTWKLEFKTLYTDERKTAVGHVNLIR